MDIFPGYVKLSQSLTDHGFKFTQEQASPACARAKVGRKQHVPTDGCVVIEDSGIGLAAAKAAEMACCVTMSTYTSGEDFSAADLVVPELGVARRVRRLRHHVDRHLLGVQHPPVPKQEHPVATPHLQQDRERERGRARVIDS